jgi:DNA-binding NarL/FixJ family response regulator
MLANRPAPEVEGEIFIDIPESPTIVSMSPPRSNRRPKEKDSGTSNRKSPIKNSFSRPITDLLGARKTSGQVSVRIVVVDDHPLFRHGLVQLLNSEPAFAVCGEADSASEAMTVVRKMKPSMVIADLGLKGANGLELTKSLKAEFPRIPVLILSMHDEPTYAVRSLRAGASGYVTKEEALSSVLVAVHEVVGGRTYLSPGMASEVISTVVLSKTTPGASPTDQLTDRELEILDRIGKGEEMKTIAKALHLSPKTVETHRAHIKEKLKLENARQVARFAVQWASAREG